MRQLKRPIQPRLPWIPFLIAGMFFAFSGCPATPNQPESKAKTETPDDVVKRYADLDLNCGWFDPKIDMHSLLQRDPITAGDLLAVVSGFRVVHVETRGGSAVVRVEYQGLGIIGGGVEFYSWDDPAIDEKVKKFQETVDFELARIQNAWKIGQPTIGVVTPHVSLSCAKEVQQRLISGGGEPAFQQQRKEVLRQLEALEEKAKSSSSKQKQ